MYSGMKQYIRAAIDLRYRMSPYLYALERRAYETGLPIMETLCSAFQHDPACDREGMEFMWGDSILVASVVEKGQTVRPVYLPKLGEGESWYDYWTRERYAPGQTLSVPVDIASIPLFIRSGAIVPQSQTRLTNLMTQKTTALSLLLVPDTDSSFALYEDDGVSNEYQRGMYLKTQVAVAAGQKTVISFSHQGQYETAVETMHLDVIHREKSPFYVLLDQETLPHFLHRKKYEAAERGWYYSQTLKSVQIKYPNPKRDYAVTISFEEFDMIGM